MRLLSRNEELILLAVWTLRDNAYGVTIRDHIKKTAGISIMFGAIYAPLARLVDYELIESYKSDPVRERGGRSKILYRVTELGRKELERIRDINRAMWSQAPSLGEEG